MNNRSILPEYILLRTTDGLTALAASLDVTRAETPTEFGQRLTNVLVTSIGVAAGVDKVRAFGVFKISLLLKLDCQCVKR